MAIATFIVGTRRTIFSFAMFLAMYLGGELLLDRVDFFKVSCTYSDGTTFLSQTSWFTALNPFLALRTIFGEKGYNPPQIAQLPAALRAWPMSWYWTDPSSFYIVFMSIVSVVLVLPSIIFLRRLAQSNTALIPSLLKRIGIGTGDRTRKPRTVWFNPIAWREAKTKASAARSSILRYAFIGLGVLGALALAIVHSMQEPAPQYIHPGCYDAARQTIYIEGKDSVPLHVDPDNTKVKINDQDAPLSTLSGAYALKSAPLTAMVPDPNTGQPILTASEIDLADFPRLLPSDQARQWLLGATLLEFSVILLIVTNAAASTVTREKEDGTLDLLLTTPITSRYYIWGKLRGLVAFVLPLVAVPVVSALIFIIHDFLRYLFTGDTTFEWIVVPEAVLVLPGTLVIVAAFASILGMNMSLRCRTTVRAVMASVGIIAGICATLGWCGYQLIGKGGPDSAVSVVLGALSPFTLVMLLIDPQQYGGPDYAPGSTTEASVRLWVVLISWLAIGLYGLGVWTMYKSMVTNFDMTIRRQSR
jgi:ABC-type Na+ efflux pump permease subunit